MFREWIRPQPIHCAGVQEHDGLKTLAGAGIRAINTRAIQDLKREKDAEIKALSRWLNSQTAPEMGVQEEQQLLRSLDEALRDLEAGKGVPMEEVRKLAPSWVAK